MIAVDIDGTLGNYHDHFTEFAQWWLGKFLPFGYRGGKEFNEFLGIEKDLYRQIKLAYRQSGMKRIMPLMPNAKTFMDLLRDMGLEIWIATTRPWLSLDNIDPDTREWLRRFEIQHDFMIYGEYKWDEFAKRIDNERVICVVDDLIESLYQAAHMHGYTAFQPENQFTEDDRWEKGRMPLIEMAATISHLTQDWRSEHADA